MAMRERIARQTLIYEIRRIMKHRNIRWGLAGCGWVARDYVAPALRAAPSAQLVALCDPDEAAMQRIAADTPGVAAYAGIDEMLKAGIDAVYVATPNHLHRELTEKAARAGKHVLCEKPMATNLADARAMVEVCADNNVVYATAFDQRFHAAHGQLREIIAAGELGEITLARIYYACWTPPTWKPDSDDGSHDNWRVDPQRAGGGAFIDLAPHGLDLTQMLLGSALQEVACLMQRRVFDYPVDDGAALIGKFENGALLTMNVAYNCPDNFPRRTLEIVGTRGMARALQTMGQTPGGSLSVIDAATGAAREIEINKARDISPFQGGVEAFSRALLNGETFPFAPARDLHTMAILQAAIENAGGTRVEAPR